MIDDEVSRTAYLDSIQQACARLGDALEVRFYDHDFGEFDATVLNICINRIDGADGGQS